MLYLYQTAAGCLKLGILLSDFGQLSHNYTARFIELADVVNSNMPEYVVIVTDHDSYDWVAVEEHGQLIVDMRNALAGLENEKVFRL